MDIVENQVSLVFYSMAQMECFFFCTVHALFVVIEVLAIVVRILRLIQSTLMIFYKHGDLFFS